MGKLARVEGKDAGSKPAEWYESQFGEPPQYSTLLRRLGPSAAERQSLLKSYFEPAPDGESEGRVPTAAHRAIADLVVGGWIRVIVTTNFDRLMEAALEDVSITPVVIATADQAKGAPPLVHNRCTLIKVHGDYLDTRIKNSDEELSEYEPSMNLLLDRVFDEYGLVVCGWSGEYDVALRDAIERCKSRRYTTYWCSRGTVGPLAEQLIANRAAHVIPIDDADSFFERLQSRVVGTYVSGEQGPTDTRSVVDLLETYLTEDRHRIRLRKLVREATEGLVSHLNEQEFSINAMYTDEEIADRIRRLDPLCEQTVALVAHGCFDGTSEHDDVWVGMLQRLAEVDVVNPAANRWGDLFRYPALLSLYAAGIAAVATSRYTLLRALLCTPLRSSQGREPEMVVQTVYPHSIVPEGAAHVLVPHPDAPRLKYKSPLSQYLHHVLRPLLAELVPADHAYTEAFDRFEYLASLVHADISQQKHGWARFAGGCFEWRNEGDRWLPNIVGNEIQDSQEQWPPLQAGLFGGSTERLLKAKQAVDKFAAENLWR